jgi:hypothetical protein
MKVQTVHRSTLKQQQLVPHLETFPFTSSSSWPLSRTGLSALTDSARSSIPRSTSAFSVSAIEGKTTGEILSGCEKWMELRSGGRMR